MVTRPFDGAPIACAGVCPTITGGFSPRRITKFGFAVVEGTVVAKFVVAPKSGYGSRVKPLTGACERP